MPYKDLEKRREAARKGSKKWREKNPERFREVRKAFYERHKGYQRKKSLEWYHGNKERALATLRRARLKRYGLTPEQYDALGSCCAICRVTEEKRVSSATKKRFRLAVDHCHDTQKIRGLLCGNCNSGLGFFQHDVALLESAIAYLKGG